MKIGKFIYSLIVTTIIAILLFVIYKAFNGTVKPKGLENLGKIIIIPLLVIVGLILYLMQISATVTSFLAIFSISKPIKIISIILVIINVGLVVMSILLTKHVISFYF
mgnify:CR=1 FL=1